ncbi:hypothetical protein [Streptomyces longwoodensis]|uniref:hypothetical protein n=1 Tax=Streptomyces longwoodensis TaxID=68231 RepID=UPI003F4D6EA9
MILLFAPDGLHGLVRRLRGRSRRRTGPDRPPSAAGPDPAPAPTPSASAVRTKEHTP